MKTLKIVLSVMMALCVCALVAGCMNNDTANPQATANGSFAPDTTAANTQPPVAFDWVTGSGTIEGNVNRISEVSDCRIVVTGTTALVGVKFTSAYQGDVTERIREMVASEVMKADPSIQTVAVTSEKEDVDKIYEISEKLRSGTPADSLAGEINAIVRNATTLR